MLKNIPKIIPPELLKILCEMGHGDELVVADGYLRESDWRVKENSTVTYSVGGLILSNSGAITANYWLSEIYDEEIANPIPKRRTLRFAC